MTKHSKALPCIDQTKARKMTKFKIYRNNIFSPHHGKVNAQLPHTAPFFFVTATPQFWSLSHRVTALKMAQLRNTASPHDPPPPCTVLGNSNVATFVFLNVHLVRTL